MLILAACTDSKTRAPEAHLRMRDYAGSVTEVAPAWRTAVERSADRGKAVALYKGGYWKAIEAALGALPRARVGIVSAGLGLVGSDELVPSYAATFSSGQDDQVPGGETRAGAAAWWSALGGPTRLTEAAVDKRNGSAIVCALPATYLAPLEPALERLIDLVPPERFVILGRPRSQALAVLSVPLDARAIRRVGGSAGQLSGRVLAWLAREGIFSRRWSRTTVAAAVAGLVGADDKPIYPVRTPQTDAKVCAWITKQLTSKSPPRSASEALRALRARGWACEELRFRALYRETAAAVGQLR